MRPRSVFSPLRLLLVAILLGAVLTVIAYMVNTYPPHPPAVTQPVLEPSDRHPLVVVFFYLFVAAVDIVVIALTVARSRRERATLSSAPSQPTARKI